MGQKETRIAVYFFLSTNRHAVSSGKEQTLEFPEVCDTVRLATFLEKKTGLVLGTWEGDGLTYTYLVDNICS
jgi:hypothetical protein